MSEQSRIVFCIKQRLICLLFLLFVSSPLAAGTVSLTDRIVIINNGTELTNPRDFLSTNQAGEFKIAQTDTLHLGFGDRPYWIKIDISGLDAGEQWILELATCKLKRIDLFYQSQSGSQIHEVDGSHSPATGQRLNSRSFAFLLKNADLSQPVYLKVDSYYYWIPIHLWSTPDYFAKEQTQVLSDGIFFGIVFAIFCYHLFIFIALRNRSYLFYAIFLLVILFWYLSGEGWVFAFLYSKWPPPFSDLTHLSSPLLGLFLLLTGIQFTRSYLRLWLHSPLTDKFLVFYQWFLAAIGGVGVVFLLSGQYAAFAMLYNVGFLGIFMAIFLCFFSGFQAKRKGEVTARYYLAATLLQFLIGIVMILSVFEWLPLPYSWKVLQFSSIVEMLIFSFGLSRQVKQINRQKEEIRKELVSVKEDIREQQEKLELMQDRLLTRVMESRVYPEITKMFPILNKVIYIQAIGNFSRIVYREDGMEREIELQASLKDIEKCFSSDHFLRIHKTYLIRKGTAYSLQRRTSADYNMVSHYFVLPVGRKYVKFLKQYEKSQP